jgi:hypothetical protein
LRKEEVVRDISKVSMGGEEKVIPVVGKWFWSCLR